MRVPGTLSSASGFSRIGFHRSVPGIRPYKRHICYMERRVHHHHHYHTRMVIRVFEERCTTISKDIIRLTTTPTSMFQIIERKNVRDISERSSQEFILQHIIMSHTMRDDGGYAKPIVIQNFMWSLGQKAKDNAGDTKMRGYETSESTIKKKIQRTLTPKRI